MARLLLGPLLRYVDGSQATVWVEADAPCEVEVLGARSRTFTVCGRHYALVHVEGLAPGSTTPYEVALDGERVWPLPGSGFPPSVIRTIDPDRTLRLAFGSCRVAVPHEPPWTYTKDRDDRGREVDALHALALRMRDQPQEAWPDALLLIGDQVYADEDAPETRAFIRSRRDTSEPPGEEVLDYEEYCHLYHETWAAPSIRWLLSTVSSAMLFDDHDVHDDWNTSQSWLEEMRAQPWWEQRITRRSRPTSSTSTSATCRRRSSRSPSSTPRCARPTTPASCCTPGRRTPTPTPTAAAGATRATSGTRAS